ncbi:MAG: non-canonical purine NTP pyrophosphatase [Acidobacteria bacterium]|nr:MAG: non-canonical purine NTP pyrophosphatase [Acidobacteriota bacterium]REK10680.1 MAG: non-canonical purine NTP pyrophosphatase [Acidobacteriota bacterium]
MMQSRGEVGASGSAAAVDLGSVRLPPFVLVSGNPGKVAETERILGRALRCRAIDLPEIQSADLRTVLSAKAEEAWRRLSEPLVVEETGLGLAALNGFPGPLVKWMLAAIGSEGIGRLAQRLGEPSAVAECAVCYCDGERRIVGFGATPGQLLGAPRGDGGFGWDPVFVPRWQPLPAGQRPLTYAELGDAEKDRSGHRGLAWRDLVGRLVEAGLAQPASPAR